MNKCSKTLLCCLLGVSFGALASPFPDSASQAGIRMYRTGQPVPAQYLAADNVIQNYHHYHLSKPADGYEWVHGVENEYLLVSIKSGILREVDTRPYIAPESPAGK